MKISNLLVMVTLLISNLAMADTQPMCAEDRKCEGALISLIRDARGVSDLLGKASVRAACYQFAKYESHKQDFRQTFTNLDIWTSRNLGAASTDEVPVRNYCLEINDSSGNAVSLGAAQSAIQSVMTDYSLE
ncbi:MAG: hypothetical protein ACXWP5_08540 [Bdellovibrionota bacterium]